MNEETKNKFKRIAKDFPAPAGFVCVGYGDREKPLYSQFYINGDDIYMETETGLSNGYSGNEKNFLYFVKKELWNEIFPAPAETVELSTKVSFKVTLHEKIGRESELFEKLLTRIRQGRDVSSSSTYEFKKGEQFFSGENEDSVESIMFLCFSFGYEEYLICWKGLSPRFSTRVRILSE